MEDFIFHEGAVPFGYRFSFTESLFNQKAHRQLQSKSNWHSFFILNNKEKTISGSIHFHLQDGVAKSPFKATAGGFDLCDGLHHEAVLGFVIFVERELRKLGTTKIVIKLPLRMTDENEYNSVEGVLIRSGFDITLNETGCIVEVSDSFDTRIHHSEKGSLKKSIDSHFEFINAPINELQYVYSFLQQCHREKKYSLSMSFPEIHDLANQFPDCILLFMVKDKEQLVAASICIRVSEKILYDFCHNHDATYNTFSPIVFLVKGIHDYCYTNQIPLIDLGTAMIGNKVNTGLLEFKLKLGSNRAVKYSFEKNYI